MTRPGPSRYDWTPASGQRHDGTLAARVLGSGPPVLFLHGMVASSVYWGGAFDDLGADHQLIAADLLGFGRSSKPPTGYTSGDHVAAIVDLLDGLGVSAPATVVSHSAGATVALRLAATQPGRVRAVVAFGPALYANADAARVHLAEMGPMARLFALPGPLASWACAWVCDHRDAAARLAVQTHPSLPAPIAADSVAHTWASYSESLIGLVLAGEAGSWLDSIRAPVTLIAGDDDPVVDRPFLSGLEESGARSYVWRGDHHLPVRRSRDAAAFVASLL